MARHEKTIVTGIYRTTYRKAKGKLSAALKEAFAPRKLRDDLDKYERWATAIEKDTAAYLEPKATKEQIDGTRRTAQSLLHLTREMRKHLDSNGTAEKALAWAINLGRMVEKLSVLPLEPIAQSGRQRREITKKMQTAHANAVAHDPQKKADAIKYYRQLMRMPETNKQTAELKVKAKYGIPPRTLRHWLKSLASP